MCNQCESKPVYEFTNGRKVCRLCFIKWFQKKFLYTVRKFGMISKGDIINYDNQGFRGKVLEDLLKMFAERGVVELIRMSWVSLPNSRPRMKVFMDYTSTTKSLAHPKTREVINKKTRRKRVGVIAIPNTSDIESYKIINEIIKGDEKNLKDSGPVVGNVIKPLYLFLDKEVLLYAKIKKLKFKSLKEKKDGIGKFIDTLEKKHPEVKYAVIKSYLKLYC